MMMRRFWTSGGVRCLLEIMIDDPYMWL
jgi:hypothetical protein